jgi:outer membrane protein OmpA-like peptidoglycan-associated protein
VQPRIDERVTYSATGQYSDGTSAPLPDTPISAPGGRVSGDSVSWSTPGSKTVIADCGGGIRASATADVQQIIMVVRGSVGNSAYFGVNKSLIERTADQRGLAPIAEVLRAHPEIKLVIDGHADSDGPAARNAKLAMSRAEAVRDQLATLGVPVDRMTIIVRSFGECRPVASNATATGRAQNRRVEIREFGDVAPGPADAACPEAGRERKP